MNGWNNASQHKRMNESFTLAGTRNSLMGRSTPWKIDPTTHRSYHLAPESFTTPQHKYYIGYWVSYNDILSTKESIGIKQKWKQLSNFKLIISMQLDEQLY